MRECLETSFDESEGETGHSGRFVVFSTQMFASTLCLATLPERGPPKTKPGSQVVCLHNPSNVSVSPERLMDSACA